MLGIYSSPARVAFGMVGLTRLAQSEGLTPNAQTQKLGFSSQWVLLTMLLSIDAPHRREADADRFYWRRTAKSAIRLSLVLTACKPGFVR